MTPAQHKKALAAAAAKIDQQARAAFDDLIERIRRGDAPREAIAKVMATFNGAYVKELSQRFTDLLGEYVGPKEVRSLRVGKVAMSTLLYMNAKELGTQVQKIVKDHAAGFHDARALAMTLYKGYQYGPDVLKIEKGLPQYLDNLFGRYEAAKLKTPALRAAYLQAIEGLESETGVRQRFLHFWAIRSHSHAHMPPQARGSQRLSGLFSGVVLPLGKQWRTPTMVSGKACTMKLNSLCQLGSPPISLSQTMVSEHFSRFPATANQTVNTAF